MRILHVDHSPVLGGAERSVFELAVAQSELGHDVAVAVGQPDGLSTLLDEADVRWHDLAWPREYLAAPANSNLRDLVATGPRVAQAGRRLERLVKRSRPDIIQIHTRKAQLVATLASRLPRDAVLFHLHEWPPTRQLVRSAARLSVRRAGHAIAVSRSVIDAYDRMKVKPRSGRIGLVHSCVSTERLRALDTPWLDGERPPVVGFVGHIGAMKAPHLLLEAAEHLADVDARFRFVGDVWFPGSEGEYGRWFENRLARSPARDRVERVGTTADPVEAFEGIDVLVHTSTHPEGFGRVLVEAMAARRPIVAFRLGPVPEIVEERSAWFAATTTGKAVADAIRAVVSDPASARERAEIAAARALDFQPLDVARRMEHEYRAMNRHAAR